MRYLIPLEENYFRIINANFFVFKPVKLIDREVQEEVLKAVESLSINEKYDINIAKEPFNFDFEAQIEATLKKIFLQ
tara:strand:- start:1133 stop:1363 length:231 start_codon:yes stop_codon:yes gene_type:complete